jgi:NAD(P)H-hydrate epimerase
MAEARRSRWRRVREVPRLPPRRPDSHKGTFGTVGIVAGSDGMLGAAILAARGALRGGAGLVRAYLPAALRAPFTVAVPAATTAFRSVDATAGVDALVVGPGLGATAGTRRLLRGILARAGCPVVLDADALNVLAPLRAPLRVRGGCVVTPHPGEAARLLGTTVAAVQADRAAAARLLATRTGQVAVLKGAATLVTDGVRGFVNDTGNPGLATGGSGDVLAGLLGALLAQGLAPFDAACLAVHAHGAAGDLVAQRLSQPGLTAEDLPLALAEVLGRYVAGPAEA